MDAQRVGQADQHYLRGHALRKQARSCMPPLAACPPLGSMCHTERTQGSLEAAKQEFSASLVLEPGHFKALFNRAYVHDRVRAWAACSLIYKQLRGWLALQQRPYAARSCGTAPPVTQLTFALCSWAQVRRR